MVPYPFALAVLLVPALQAQKLNAPLPRDPGEAGGDVVQLRLSPVGGWGVYAADETDGLLELFSAPLDQSASSRKLSAGEALDVFPGAVFEVDATGSRVVYLGQVAGQIELFSAPIDGSEARVRLNGALPPGGGVASFVIAPAGDRVVYLSRELSTSLELFSVPIDGGSAPVHLNADRPVWTYLISPDGTRVVYTSDEVTAGVTELFSVPIEGGAAPVRISIPLSGNRDVIFQFAITADGARVLYRSDRYLDDVLDLCSVPLDPGSGLPSLSTAVPSYADVGEFRLSPAGDAVLFVADVSVDDRFDLFYAPVDGSAVPVQVSGTLVAGGDVQAVTFSADGSRAVFLADKVVDGRVELFSVPVDRSTPAVRLSPDLIAAGDVATGIRLAGSRVLFLADAVHDGSLELYSVEDAGGVPARLHAPLAAGRTVTSGFLVGEGGRVLFVSDLDRSGVFELWSAPSDASAAPVRVSGALGLAGDVRDLAATGAAVSSDGLTVAFLADLEVDETFQLLVAPLDGAATPAVLNGPLDVPPIVGDVSRIGWSPDGSHAVYVADQQVDGLSELYAVDVLHGIGPYRLSGAVSGGVAPTSAGEPAWFGPDETRLVYDDRLPSIGYASGSDLLSAVPVDGSQAAVRVDLTVSSFKSSIALTEDRVVFIQSFGGFHPPPFRHLWSAPLDGSALPIPLSPESDEGISVFQITPDGQKVVYLDDFGAGLQSVPTDGSAASTPLLNTPLLSSPVLVPAGDRVVCLADAALPGVRELFVLPIDGSGSPQRLNAPLGPGQAVDLVFLLTPDGSRVVYVADQDTPGVTELYSAPLAGGPGVKLSAEPIPGGNVPIATSGTPTFALTPDGQRVVFRADLDTDEVHEIYAAPVDGSVPAVRLNDPLSGTQDVEARSLRLSADSRRVVWAADAEVEGRLDLHAAPVDGSQPAVRITPDPVAGGSVAAFNTTFDPVQLGRHGGRAFYRADQDVDGRIELYSVPLDGSAVATRINDPLVAGGNVRTFAIDRSGRKILYLADQEVDETVEVYLVELPASDHQAPASAPTRMVTAGSDQR